MKRAEKEQLVAELQQKIAGADGVIYTDFTGLNVKSMTELRRRFLKAGVSKADADAMKAKLEAEGAVVEVK
ncbi:MAG: 50S ribosomal protein L10 [Gemmatimonadota bacterium]